MKATDIDLTDPLQYYNKRIEELNFLEQQANSKTTKSLIEEAMEKSGKLLQKNLELQKQTVRFIHQENAKLNATVAKIDEQLDLVRMQLSKLNQLSEVTEKQRFDAEEYLNKVIALGLKTREARATSINLQASVMAEASLTFQSVLLNDIFKPNSSQFNYDTIVDGLKFVAGLFLPTLDALMTVSETPASALLRKKQYLGKGNKVLVYLEQYLDVMEKWDLLAGEFMKIIDD